MPRFETSEFVLVTALAALVLCLTVTPLTNNDIFLHLKMGEIIYESGSVPRVDDFSALARGRPWVAHEWLAALVFYAVERLTAIDGLIALKAIVAITTVGLLHCTSRTFGGSPVASAITLGLVAHIAAARVMERPHIFTYLLSASFLLLLARRSEERRAWIFLPLQTLWANLHGGFLFGPVLVTLAAIGRSIDARLEARWAPPRTEAEGGFGTGGAGSARLAVLALGCLAISAVNPFGPRLLVFPLQHLQNPLLREVYEWLPPFRRPFSTTYVALYYLAWTIGGAIVLLSGWRFALRDRRLPPGGAFVSLLFGCFFLLSLRANRYVVDFGLITAPGIAATGTMLWARRGTVLSRHMLAAVVTTVLLVIAVTTVKAGYADRPDHRRRFGLGLGERIPVRAADYLVVNGFSGNVFNDYTSGAYLIYRAYPKLRVTMDSRNEVYGPDLYRAYAEAMSDPHALEEMLRRLDAVAIFLALPSGEPVANRVERLGGWRLGYRDTTAIVFVRDGRTPQRHDVRDRRSLPED